MKRDIMTAVENIDNRTPMRTPMKKRGLARAEEFKLNMNEDEDVWLREIADEFFTGNRSAALRTLIKLCKDGKEVHLVNKETGVTHSIKMERFN